MAKKTSKKSKSKQFAATQSKTTQSKSKNSGAKAAQAKLDGPFIANFEGQPKSGEKQKDFLANLKTLTSFYA